MVRFIAEEKKGVDDTKLRCLVLVPTKVLGMQVFRELQPLLRHTTIAAAHWCSDASHPIGASKHARSTTSVTSKSSTKDELRQLLHTIRPPPLPTARFSSSPLVSFTKGPLDPPYAAEVYVVNVDILITTPQRLLQHLDRVEKDGLPSLLSSLQLLVMDEADEVLGGQFAYAVSKVVELYEAEKRRQEQERLHKMRLAGQLLSDVPYQETSGTCDSSSRRKEKKTNNEGEEMKAAIRRDASVVHGALLAPVTTSPRSAYSFLFPRRPTGEEVMLHKILCSATLSSRIARISQVRLRNCIFFSLNSKGKSLAGVNGEGDDENATALLSSSYSHSSDSSALASSLGLTSGGTNAKDAPVGRSPPLFSFPPTLQEHVVFVDEANRYAVLLKLVRTLMQKHRALYLLQRRRQRLEEEEVMRQANFGDEDDDLEEMMEEEEEAFDGGATFHSKREKRTKKQREELKMQYDEEWKALTECYPPVHPSTGNRVLVFCSSADEARVIAHYLFAGGVPGVLEFTTAATDLERRRVLLQQGSAKSRNGLSSPHPRLGSTPSGGGGQRASTHPSSTSHQGRPSSDDRLLREVDVEDVEMSEEATLSCIVASDALMRGMDIPGVSHVIMYRPPETLSQLIHRAGRTARATRQGHVHLLLTKKGMVDEEEEDDSDAEKEKEHPSKPKKTAKGLAKSRKQEERETAAGQVAKYAALSASVARTLPLRFERGFFKFRHLPSTVKQPTVSDSTTSEGPTATTEYTEEDAEWWVEEASRCLQRSQHRLQRSWSTVMEVVRQHQQLPLPPRPPVPSMQKFQVASPTASSSFPSSSSPNTETTPRDNRRRHANHHENARKDGRRGDRASSYPSPSGTSHPGRSPSSPRKRIRY